MGPARGHRAGEPGPPGLEAQDPTAFWLGFLPSLPGASPNCNPPLPAAMPAPALTDSLGGGPALLCSPEPASDLRDATLFFIPSSPPPALLPFDEAMRTKGRDFDDIKMEATVGLPCPATPPRRGDSQGKQAARALVVETSRALFGFCWVCPAPRGPLIKLRWSPGPSLKD